MISGICWNSFWNNRLSSSGEFSSIFIFFIYLCLLFSLNDDKFLPKGGVFL